MAKAKTKQQLTLENEELKARLRELEETLEAIRSGAVDAIVTSGPAGDRVYTLEGADHAYHSMVESMNEGAVTILPDGTILYGNRQIGQMTGASPSGIVGRPFHDFVPASDRQTLDGFICQALSGGLKAEMRLRNGSAAEIPVQISATPIDLGGTRALALVVTDLSERRRYDEIVAAERLSRYILEQSMEGVAVCVNGRILFASRRLHEICGRNPLLQPFDSLFPLMLPDSEPFSVEIPQSGKVVKGTEVVYRNPEGKNFALILNAGPLYGDDHQILGSLVSLTDISERKQAEEEIARLNRELQQRVQELEAVFETAPIGLAIAEDPEGRHIRGNPANERMFGVPHGGEFSKRPSEPAGFRVLHDGREMTVDELPMQRAVRGEKVSGQIVNVVRTNGSTIRLYSNASPLLDEQGRPRGAVGAFLDVTKLTDSQEALRESEDRYRSLVDTAPDAIVVHRDGWFLFANEAALRLYGADDFEQLKSRNIVELLHPDDREIALQRIEKVQAGERTALRESRLLKLNGQEAVIEATAAPINYGGQRAVQVILRDITLRRQAEEALRESEERYRGVVQNTTAVILRLDLQGIIRFANERALQYFGYSAEELFGKRAVGTIVPERESTGRDLAAMVDGIAENPDRYHSNSNENIRKNGERVWMEWTNSGIYDRDGRLKEVLSVGIDTTARKQAEEALNESRQRLAVIVDSIADGFYALDRSWRFTHVNDAALRHMGKTREELLGRKLLDIFPESRGSFIETEYARAMESGEPRHFKNPSLITGRILEIHAYPGGEILTVLFRDVTEQTLLATALRDSEESLRLANEHLEQRVRERTMDLHNLTGELERSRHELRNLVSELVMAEERERKRIAGVLHDEIAQTLAAARMRLDLLQGTVSDQRDTQTLQEVKTFLVQSIQETRALMSDVGNPLLFDMGLKAACESHADQLMKRHPVRILCDIRDAFKNLHPDVKTILYQLVRELLTNVVKHSQARNAHVLIDLEDGNFQVKVADDGVGFDPGALGAPTVDGGFGLYSIRERLLAIDGSLGIISSPGTGTVVTAIVPAAMK